MDLLPFSKWQDRGLDMYRDLFEKYAEHGINVVEVWLCSWWLAPEWIPDAVGNHGIGHMNQHRSWLLDRIMEMAEAHDIYVILLFHNHGKFSKWCDAEWARNPYNKRNDGFLNSPEEFFDNSRADRAFERYADYIVSRWGYSPHILAWKLFSEIDLTGAVGNREFYKDPSVKKWHQRMSAYLKEIDPWKHMVTTHWATSVHFINDPIARISDLDILTTDAYHRKTTGVIKFFRDTMDYTEKMRKPVILTEFGGDPYGTKMNALLKQVHLGLWQGTFNQFAIPPMLWWFALLDEKDLYDRYAALAEFMENEDLRGSEKFKRREVGQNSRMWLIQQDERLLGWVYDKGFYLSERLDLNPAVQSGPAVEVGGMQPGVYQLRFYDTRTAEVLAARRVTVASDGRLSAQCPDYVRDIAFKAIRAE
jgi:endo-1,4-beta-mannosidase